MSIEIELSGISKKFKRDWVIKNLSYQINLGSKTAILGANGSGKSTLLKIICGFTGTSKGEVKWHKDDNVLDITEWHSHFSYSAPYLELIEEFTLKEMLDLHFKLKPELKSVNRSEILTDSGLLDHMDKPIVNYSSGMKQRVKLILCLCSDVDVYFLDEPCSNLDDEGVLWYHKLVNSLPENKTIIVGSNSTVEYSFCDEYVRVVDFK